MLSAFGCGAEAPLQVRAGLTNRSEEQQTQPCERVSVQVQYMHIITWYTFFPGTW